MKKNKLLILLCLILIFNGCASFSSKKEANPNLKTYFSDLNGDGIKEIIEVENLYDTKGEVIIRVIAYDKKKLDEITIPGRLIKIEFIQLNADNTMQLAVSYEDNKADTNLNIYQLKSEKLYKIFVIATKCGIESYFDSSLARIKVGRPKHGEKECSRDTVVSEWDVWVWTGEKFIKEIN
jgi:hypothetical protein